MKKTHFITFLVSLLLISSISNAQNSGKWTLNSCISYALENNIDIKSSKVSILDATEDLIQAKNSQLPTLTLSSNQSVVNQKIDDGSGNFTNNGSYSGSYSLSSGITIFNGGVLTNSIKQKAISQKSSQLSEEETKNNIQISVTQAFLQILYANETVKTNIEAVSVSQAQLLRAKALFDAGSISSVDLAQFESQLSNDKYQLTLSQNDLDKSKLTLKQILELDSNVEFDIEIPVLDDKYVLEAIPSVNQVYSKAIEVMPQIERSNLLIENAKIGEKISEAGKVPTISASASIGTGNVGSSQYTFAEQLNNRLSQNIGLSISLPIYNRRSVKTQINKAKLQTESAILNNKSTEKQLLSTIEGLQQDAVSAQSKYIASKDKLKYYTQSYNLMSEQFNSGIKNTVELMSERKNLLAAQQDLIESKFQSILSLKLLKFYQNEPIEL